jgi:chemotaxis protein MotB
MMKKLFKTFVFIIAGSILLTSCVSSKKYKDLQSEKDAMTQNYEKQIMDIKKGCSAKETELNDRINSLSNEASTCKSDMMKYKNMSDEKAAALAKLEKDIREAFASFDNPDLKIIQKADKMYISLPNRILFMKGSDKLSKDGNTVLDLLSGIFKKNPKMDILVEGHTDHDPVVKTRFKFKDNWGLSAARSLNALRYLVKQGVPEKQLTAAGRADQVTTGELMDGIDKSAYDRRIEFVITPDVHKLYSIKEGLK